MKGDEAVEAFKRNPPSLILLDIMLPAWMAGRYAAI